MILQATCWCRSNSWYTN